MANENNNSLFELYNSLIKECRVEGDKIVLKCLYMQLEYVNVTFENVSSTQNFSSLKGNIINYMEETEDGYQIYFINEKIKPAVIHARNFTVEWI